MKQHFDVVILGGGMGGLLCGTLLSMEGYKVAVLEKNIQAGGSLQSFSVQGKLFESAVHYIGSMQQGQTLYKIFNYLQIIDKLGLEPLEKECFDEIVIGNKKYPLAQGYENFIAQLAIHFPHQQQALEQYIFKIKYVCAHFPLYNMRTGSIKEKLKVAHWRLDETINQLIDDPLLKKVILGNHMLYAGHESYTPFFVHALIQNSYIESSWKFKNGSTQLAKSLCQLIKNNQGEIFRNETVLKLHHTENKITSAETDKGMYIGKYFISSLHPTVTYALTQAPSIKPITKKRILSTPNSIAAFMINIVVKPNTITYKNHNTYIHLDSNIWADLEQENETPQSVGIFYYQDKNNPRYADRISILSYMPFSFFEKWQDTAHTIAAGNNRPQDYITYKNLIANRIIEKIQHHFSLSKSDILAMDVCTPLTYRDYLNIPQGSMYGILHNTNDLMNTTYATRTKLDNLYLTGQNINLHGILGVSVTALLTVAELTGLDYLVNKINDANK